VRKYLIDQFCEWHGEARAKVNTVLDAWKKFEIITPTLH
jgi:hypothetical protein